jgi:predicted phage-related endonuclease
MSDFSPEVRASAIWSNDARRICEGRAGEVYAEKIGIKPLDDLSDKEFVMMGLVMQEPIMREFARRQGINFKDADYSMRHHKWDYLASHFDYISEDGKTLYEIKNVGIQQRKKYGESGSTIIDSGYYIQCLHESTVHGIEDVILVVCFGGQEICYYPLSFTADQWDAHAQAMGAFWGHCQSRTFDPETMSDAVALVYPQDDGSVAIADSKAEEYAASLAVINKQLAALAKDKKKYGDYLRAVMGKSATLRSADGSVIATWNTPKSSMGFSEELFQQAMPDIYKQFIVEKPGARKLLIK